LIVGKIFLAMVDSPVNSPEQASFADINNNHDAKAVSDKSIDSPEGTASLFC
jgi:hypothetical protein